MCFELGTEENWFGANQWPKVLTKHSSIESSGNCIFVESSPTVKNWKKFDKTQVNCEALEHIL